MSEKQLFDVRNIVAGVNQIAPEEFAQLNCKLYKNADRFSDPRILLANLAVANKFSSSPYILQMNSFDRRMAYLQAITAKNLIKFNVPTFFVEGEMLKSCLNTEPPKVVDWSELKLPYETGIFIFPKNFLLFPDGTECGHLMWCRINPGVYQFVHNKMSFDKKTFLTFTSSLSGYNFHRLLNAPFEPETAMELYDFIESKQSNNAELLKLSESEQQFELKLNSLLFNLLLVMTNRETLVKTGERIGRHKKKSLDIWTPNIFGHNYQIKREYNSANSHLSGIKQKYHWRGGHWRTQHYGQANYLTKRIWIEPYMVL